MSIQGKDVTVPVGPQVDQEGITYIVGTFWPEAVRMTLPDYFGSLSYFFFRTQEAHNAFLREGITEDARDDFVQVTHGTNDVSFTVLESCSDEHDWLVAQIVKQLV